MKLDKLKVMIVDRNSVSIGIISSVLAGLQGIEVVTTATSGGTAVIRLIHTAVDLILFDIMVSDQNGLSVLNKIRKIYPDVGVVILSDADPVSVNKTINALEIGALDFVTRPIDNENSIRDFRRQFKIITGLFQSRKGFRAVRDSAQNPLPERGASEQTTLQKPALPVKDSACVPLPHGPDFIRHPRSTRIDAVAIGASTGGPSALIEVIPRLPGDLGVPFFLVQHMPPFFTATFAENMDKRSALNVIEATNGQDVQPNTVYIAPGGKHMIVHQKDSVATLNNRRRLIGLNDDPPENSCRPSVDILLRSLVPIYMGNILVVIMTGMGKDGMQGVAAIKHKGGYCLSQSDDTCVVYGMPRFIDQAGLADDKVPLNEIANRIVALIRKNRGIST
ncbi:MAG: chemotaxis-specific protein-glutamate methyltransferase CheB [Thermodesulfobacteriota bacterium]|nr:chemotaxis-specific protein-glutamate methyltransferase CheB [Thermodesulfobacteriota bacterium]